MKKAQHEDPEKARSSSIAVKMKRISEQRFDEISYEREPSPKTHLRRLASTGWQRFIFALEKPANRRVWTSQPDSRVNTGTEKLPPDPSIPGDQHRKEKFKALQEWTDRSTGQAGAFSTKRIQTGENQGLSRATCTWSMYAFSKESFHYRTVQLNSTDRFRYLVYNGVGRYCFSPDGPRYHGGKNCSALLWETLQRICGGRGCGAPP